MPSRFGIFNMTCWLTMMVYLCLRPHHPNHVYRFDLLRHPWSQFLQRGMCLFHTHLFIQVMKASKSQLQRLMQIKVPLSTSTTYFAKPRLSSKVPVLSGPNIAFYMRNNSTRSLKIDIPGPPLLSSYILLPTAQASSCFTTKYVSYKYAQMKRAIG